MSRDHEKPPSRSRGERDDSHHSKKAKKHKSKEKRHSSSRRRDRHDRHGKDSDSSDADVALPSGANKISQDDYFLRATEFRVWLKHHKGKYVEELSTEEAMRYFETKFVKKWNSGKLDRMFYKGIPESVLEQTKRTRHAWGFVKNLNDKEKMDLATAKDSVVVSTRKQDLIATAAAAAAPQSSSSSREVISASSNTTTHTTSKYGPSTHDNDTKKRTSHSRAEEEGEDEDDDYERRRRRRRTEEKRDRKHRESVLDELVPKETGRQAQLEKKRQLSDKMHGAARDRDANCDGLDLDDDFLMGGSARGDGAGEKADLQKRLTQRASARQRKEQEMRDRVEMANAKETARMDKFLLDMGIPTTGGKPITIQPRRDA